jgi:hypothetical protein
LLFPAVLPLAPPTPFVGSRAVVTVDLSLDGEKSSDEGHKDGTLRTPPPPLWPQLPRAPSPLRRRFSRAASPNAKKEEDDDDDDDVVVVAAPKTTLLARLSAARGGAVPTGLFPRRGGSSSSGGPGSSGGPSSSGRGTALGPGEDEAEVAVLGTVGGAGALPHARAHCPDFPFHRSGGGVAGRVAGGVGATICEASAESNARRCVLCYCWVCDAPAAECSAWEDGGGGSSDRGHCHAHERSPYWRSERKHLATQRTAVPMAAPLFYV